MKCDNTVWRRCLPISKERYQGHGWSDYSQSREEVCEVYGVDPKKASVHHIVFRSDVLHNPDLKDFDLNKPANLYPFSKDNPEPHTNPRDHDTLHEQVTKQEHEQERQRKQEWVLFKAHKRKLKTIYKRKK